MLSTSFLAVNSSGYLSPANSVKPKQSASKGIPETIQDSFHRKNLSVKFGADHSFSEQEYSWHGLNVHDEDTRNAIIEEILGDMPSSRRERREFNASVRHFLNDPRAKAYATLQPADYIESIRNIVDKANTKLSAGRKALEKFRDRITPSAGVPARVTTSSSSLLNTPAYEHPDPGYDSDTPLGGFIRGGDGHFYKKQLKPGNRTLPGAYSGPYRSRTF